MSIDLSLTVPEPSEWKRTAEQALQAMQRAVELTAQEVFGNIAREAPVNHGRLAGSFSIEQVDDLSWKIFTNVEYAEAVQEGTKPHVIEASGRALAFESNGQMVIVKRVNHPGTAPNPYITRSLEAAQTRTDEFMRRAISEVVA